MWYLPLPDIIDLGRQQEIASNLLTLTSEKDKALQENLALRAEVEALKSQLSQCRGEMVSFYGTVTGIAADLGELLLAAEDQHDKINKRQVSEGRWDGRSYVRRSQFLTKLGRSLQLVIALQDRISRSGGWAGTTKATGSCFRSYPLPAWRRDVPFAVSMEASQK